METYKCLDEKCKHEFTSNPGAHACPKCKSKYVEWVSFKDWETDEANGGWKKKSE